MKINADLIQRATMDKMKGELAYLEYVFVQENEEKIKMQIETIYLLAQELKKTI